MNGDVTIEENALRFRDAVLASPELHARLGVFEDPAEFEAEARVIAAELGLECAFDLSLVAPRLPPFPCPPGHDEMSYLRELTAWGAAAEGLAVAVPNRADRLLEGNELIESLTE